MSKYTPEEKVKIARNPGRPGTADFIDALFTDFFEQRGDRLSREDGSILGYAGLHVIVDEGYIDNIAVTPDARRHGVASALLDVYCRFGAVNLAFLTLEVRASNEAARGLYEKYGFQQAGLRPGYYQHPREDAVIMTRYFNGQEGEQP